MSIPLTPISSRTAANGLADSVPRMTAHINMDTYSINFPLKSHQTAKVTFDEKARQAKGSLQ